MDDGSLPRYEGLRPDEDEDTVSEYGVDPCAELIRSAGLMGKVSVLLHLFLDSVGQNSVKAAGVEINAD